MPKDALILLWRLEKLLAVHCSGGQFRLLGEVACQGRDARTVAGELLEELRQYGPVPADVRLLMGDAMFRSWQLPFRTVRKAKQALGLLLDGEFPFESEALEHRNLFCGKGSQGLDALTASVFRASLDEKLDALADLGISPALVTIAPLPELLALPAEVRRKSILAVLMDEGQAIVAAIQKGSPRKIVRLAGLASLPPENLAASLQMALHGHKASALLVRGMSAERASALGDALGLPLIAPGDGKEYWRRGAEAMMALPQPGSWAWLRSPFDIPFFQRQARKGTSADLPRPLIFAACGLLLASVAWMGSVFAEDMALRKAAARYEAEARQIAQKAVPQMRKGMTLGQIESSLRARLAESMEDKGQVKSWALPLLHAIHASYPQGARLQFDSLRAEMSRQGTVGVAISGTAAEYQDVNSFRDALAGMPGIREVRVVQAANRGAAKAKVQDARQALPIGFELQLQFEEQGS